MTFATVVFLLCSITSLICMALLWRSYRRTRARLLLWSALCFVGLAVDNILVPIDVILLPHIDLFWLRQVAALAGLGMLLYGFIWEAEP